MSNDKIANPVPELNLVNSRQFLILLLNNYSTSQSKTKVNSLSSINAEES